MYTRCVVVVVCVRGGANWAGAQEYERTGYVWEQYDAISGEGKRR